LKASALAGASFFEHDAEAYSAQGITKCPDTKLNSSIEMLYVKDAVYSDGGGRFENTWAFMLTAFKRTCN
jgi:hypothetical protein